MKRFLSLKTVFFLILLSSLFFISCSARIDGSLSADGSAIFAVNMSLEPRMTTLIRSLSAAGGQSDDLVLNGPIIAGSMAEAPGITAVTLRNISPASLGGQVRIGRISEFLTAADGRRFIVFEQGVSGGRCEIIINRDNGPDIIGLLSPDIDDYLNALMAPIVTGEEINKEEYLELVASFYNRTISNEILSSRILVSIVFPSTVTRVFAPGQSGTFSARRATFDIPLLDLLVLETPLRYEVRWQ